MDRPGPFPLLAACLAAAALGSCTDTPVAYNPQPPQIVVLEPSDDAGVPEFPSGEPLTFVASVSDDMTPVEELVVTWQATRTDDDGATLVTELGEAAVDAGGRASLVATDLVADVYTVRAGVEDEDGLTAYDFVDVAVVDPNEAPTVQIAAPLDGEAFDVGTPIDFIASADDDQPPRDLVVSWNSDIDGQFDTQAPDAAGLLAFSTDALSPGDHTVTVTVTDSRGLQGMDTVAVTVIPENQPPTLPTAILNPVDPADDDDLTCYGAGSVDPEGGPVTYAYSWLKDGAPYAWADSTVPAGQTGRGETWTCIVVGVDPEGLESEPGQAQVTVENSLPSYTSVTLTPTDATETSVLTCTPFGWSDPDGDPEGRRFEWNVGGVTVGATGDQLTGADFDHFDGVTCTVYPADGHGEGMPLTSNVVDIRNTPPAAPGLAIEPSPVHPGEDLACALVVDAPDVDDDPLTYEYEWSRDGVIQGTLTAETVPGDEVAFGETWTCRARAHDLTDPGAWATAETLVVPAAGDLVVTEILAAPEAVSDSSGEYFEVWNAASYSIPLGGWTLSDETGESHTVSTARILPPGDFFVFGRNSSEASNGGVDVDYQYSGFELDDDSDAIIVSFAGVQVDRVKWRDDLGFPLDPGAAMSLDDAARSASANDLGGSWCPATSLIVPGGDFGTPGRSNDACACAASDYDGDGFGDAPECDPDFSDCRDGDPQSHPGAAEVCDDGIDQDCDGGDRPCTCGETDADGDGYGTAASCLQPDCDDADPAVHPGRAEICDGVDQDCDGMEDEDFDLDLDGWTTCSGDCADFRNDAYPGAPEDCDGADNDCDGSTDEAGSIGCTVYYTDADNDSHGSDTSACLCAPDATYRVTNSDDCYDGNASARPGQSNWFTSHRGDGSYDYDCNGTETKRYTSLASYECDDFLGVVCEAFYSEGWAGGVPSCGSSGDWATGCYLGLVCALDTSARSQECH